MNRDLYLVSDGEELTALFFDEESAEAYAQRNYEDDIRNYAEDELDLDPRDFDDMEDFDRVAVTSGIDYEVFHVKEDDLIEDEDIELTSATGFSQEFAVNDILDLLAEEDVA